MGFWEPPATRSEDDARAIIGAMNDSLMHRGPDDSGYWIDSSVGVALGHRRLAILDVSPLGAQPMVSVDGRYRVVYNGEIYNFRELKAELTGLGHEFRGGSDTEVLLAAFCQWGAEASLSRFNGMFAMAVWDGLDRRMLLARDRFGEKPLYYGKFGSTWIFASELKAFRRMPEFQGCIDRDALTLYTRLGYVPAPHSIYQGISKLPVGAFLWLEKDRQDIRRYASLPVANLDLETSLTNAVRRRMISDVPLGAFLSGGIDSSLVVALMQQVADRPVSTFSLGFQDPAFDEAGYARKVALLLGTDHHEHYVSPRDSLEVVPMLPFVYDEPFADSSQIPMLLISQIAKRHVSVVLSGDGGDEMFGGYNRYLWAPPFWRLISWLPLRLRRTLAAVMSGCSGLTGHSVFGKRLSPVQSQLAKLAEFLPLQDFRALYLALVSPWRNPLNVVKQGREVLTALEDPALLELDVADYMMQLDLSTYLADDILVKVDRASMAFGLETRAPFLDPEVLAVASSLPANQKIKGKVGKWPLRDLVYRRLPREIFERPKAGFGVPLGSWLKGELRGWAEELLSTIPHQDYFHAEPILKRWRAHQAGERDWSASLWVILMFQSWLSVQT